ncbi:HSP20-like chaperone, partial [Syncephalis pseudoplumigaleata]
WPAIDISEVDNSYVLEAELPGVAKDDVSVELDQNGEVVTLSGQVRQSEGASAVANPSTYWAQERFYGSFRRAFQLPAAVNPETVQASFRNGLLRVTMNKKEPQTPEPPSAYRVKISEE